MISVPADATGMVQAQTAAFRNAGLGGEGRRIAGASQKGLRMDPPMNGWISSWQFGVIIKIGSCGHFLTHDYQFSNGTSHDGFILELSPTVFLVLTNPFGMGDEGLKHEAYFVQMAGLNDPMSSSFFAVSKVMLGPAC